MNTRPVFFRISRNRRKAASAPAMRPKALSGSIAKYSRGLALSVLTLIGASQAPGATYYWDADDITAGAGATPDGTWGTSNFWNTDLTGGAGGSFTTATFNTDDLSFVAGPSATSGNNAYTVTVSASQVANTLNFQASGATTISGGTLITVGNGTSGNGGINIPQFAFGSTNNGAVTISTAVTLNNTQTWTNNSANTLTVNTGALAIGSNTLTIGGSGNTTLSSSSITGSNIAKIGAGTLTITTAGASNLYTGTTAVSNGTLLLNSSGTIAAKGGTTVAAGGKLQLQGGLTYGDALTISGLNAVIATGGTVTTDGTFEIHTFTGSGALSVTSGGSVQYLVVGGGGGGGNTIGGWTAGGGGAGGLLTGTTFVSSGSASVTVGAGGSGGTNVGLKTGGDSTLLSFTAKGGGYGANQNTAAGNGGSGGGGGGQTSINGGGGGGGWVQQDKETMART